MKKALLIAAIAVIAAVTPAKQVSAQEVEATEATVYESAEVREELPASDEEDNEASVEAESSLSEDMTGIPEVEAPSQDEVVETTNPVEDGSESEPIMEEPPERECPSVVEIGEVDYDLDKGEVVSVTAIIPKQETEPESKITHEQEETESTETEETATLAVEDEFVMSRVLQAQRVKGTKKLGFDRPLTRSVQTGDKENAALLTLIIGVLVFSMVFLNTYNLALSRAKEYFVRAIVRSKSNREKFGSRQIFILPRHEVTESAPQGFRFPYREQRIGYCRV